MKANLNKVKKRLKLQLNAQDKGDIKTAVLQYVATADSKQISKYLAYDVGCQILPELKKINKDWLGVTPKQLKKRNQAIISFHMQIEKNLSMFCKLWHTAAQIMLFDEISDEDSVQMVGSPENSSLKSSQIKNSQQSQRGKYKSRKLQAISKKDDNYPEELESLLNQVDQKRTLQDKITFSKSFKSQSKKASPSRIKKSAKMTPSLRRDLKAGIRGSDGHTYKKLKLGLNSQ